jgi:Protein of unknown function (DUF3606)
LMLGHRREYAALSRTFLELLLREGSMAKKAMKSARGRKQDRAHGGQDYEVRYTAKKTRKSGSPVKKAVKKVGSSRKRVVKALKRKR